MMKNTFTVKELKEMLAKYNDDAVIDLYATEWYEDEHYNTIIEVTVFVNGDIKMALEF